ncbi:MAG: hypothetical protein JW807_15155 [Spirochaetes bacterium]|nr:hypothetical protein [Spirochaetota bacterium]
MKTYSSTVTAAILSVIFALSVSARAQFITDENEERGRKTIGELRDEGLMKPKVRPIIGIDGGASVRDGAASVSTMLQIGMQYDRYIVTADPVFIYLNAQSLQGKKNMTRYFLRTKTSGQVYEFALPVKFNYVILNMEKYQYAPYVSAGAGYSFRSFALDGSSFISHTSRAFDLHSLTLNFGFGFLVKTTAETKFNVGINGVSYFNTRSGIFDYDTTGASLHFGMMVFIR